MKYTLRPYQAEASDAAIEWVRKSIEPALIEAATGAGKSLIIADFAHRLHRISKGKHILCLAPSAELVEQNREKFLLTGEPASIYSASAGQKCLRYPVVFGTPGTFKKAARRVAHRFCAVVIDEAHGITPTIKTIVSAMQAVNPNLRVIGLTATPYRLGEGYIYRIGVDGTANGVQTAKNPYFAKLIYSITADQLLDMGYLTPPTVGDIQTETYDTSGLQLNRMGKFDPDAIDQAFIGHGRKTSAIVADVVARSMGRMGVMFFAATVPHAYEILASLPQKLTRIVTADTPKNERKNIVKAFKARKFKYLVNVGVFTTGFDAEHVDVIAILRATESLGLLQQILGRGMRLHPEKKDFLVLDYAQNFARHCPDGDIFNPRVRASKPGKETQTGEFLCPECKTPNVFSLRENEGGLDIDDYGYFIDKEKKRITNKLGPIPAHYGRRCCAMHPAPGGKLAQCAYRWTYKECPACLEDNDIAAKYCKHCRAELVDPNEKLAIEFKAFKRNPENVQTDEILHINEEPTISRSGNECLRVEFKTPYRHFTVWYLPHGTRNQQRDYQKYRDAIDAGHRTVTYRKDRESSFYRVLAFGMEPDLDPSKQHLETVTN